VKPAFSTHGGLGPQQGQGKVSKGECFLFGFE
jgi:hypothetical protein